MNSESCGNVHGCLSVKVPRLLIDFTVLLISLTVATINKNDPNPRNNKPEPNRYAAVLMTYCNEMATKYPNGFCQLNGYLKCMGTNNEYFGKFIHGSTLLNLGIFVYHNKSGKSNALFPAAVEK